MSKLKYYVYVIAIILVGVVGGVLLFKPHGSQLPVKQNTEIMIWYVENGVNSNLKKTADNFSKLEDKNKNDITVKTRGFESFVELSEALKKSKSDEMPNIIACDADNALSVKKTGKTVNVSDYLDEGSLSTIDSDFIKCATYKKILVGVPYAADIDVLLVNADKVPDAANIGSIEELFKNAKAYYKDNEKPMLAIYDYARFYRTAMAQLGDEFDAVSPRDSENENSKYIYRLLAQSAFDRGIKSSKTPVEDVISGELGCAIVPASEVMEKALLMDDNIAVYACPKMEKGIDICAPELQCAVILESDENRQNASAVFVKWLISADTDKDFVSDSGYIPSAANISSIKSKHAVFDDVKAVISKLLSNTERFESTPSAEYVKNYAEFVDDMQLVMDSLR